MKIVIFLQNPWSPFYAGKKWPRQSWLIALWKSRSGKRLTCLEDSIGNANVWYDNANPQVAADPSTVLKPNRQHIEKVLRKQKPDVVIACGKQAAQACKELWSGPLLIVPHPTYRVLTNSLYKQAGDLIRKGFSGRRELVQNRNFVEHRPL